MDELSSKIKAVNELHDLGSLEDIINKLQPLIKKYSRKLFFMETEDAMQELNIALIEAIYHIYKVDNEAQCLSIYISQLLISTIIYAK